MNDAATAAELNSALHTKMIAVQTSQEPAEDTLCSFAAAAVKERRTDGDSTPPQVEHKAAGLVCLYTPQPCSTHVALR